MGPLKLYHYPSCSTCRKALRWLADYGVEVELIDIVKSPPTRAALLKILDDEDLPIKKLFNTSGQSYRDGNWAARITTTTRDNALDALAADGKLIKRPLLIAERWSIIGFSESAYTERFDAA